MKYDNKSKLDKPIKNLDHDIIWNTERQQRSRQKLISELEGNKVTQVSWLKKGIMPLLASLLLVGVLTTVILSESSEQDTTIQESDSSSGNNNMSGDNDNKDSQAILDEKNKDGEEKSEKKKQKAKEDTEKTESVEKKPEQKDRDQENVDENIDKKNHDEEKADKAEDKKSHDKQDADESDKKNHDKEKSDANEKEKEHKAASPDDDKDSSVEVSALTQSEVIQATKEQINTDLSLRLPSELPLDKDQHLTAVTKSEANSYQVTFYQSDQPIPINNEKLVDDKNAADIVAQVHVEKYDTKKEADEAISFEEFSDQGGEEIELGYDLTGYQDAGAGSTWTSWNEGRWAFAAHAQTDDAENGTDLAKEAVEYLEENALPIPKQHGFAHLDVEQQDNRILWEEETTVYTIDQVKEPMDGLKIAVNFE